MGTAPIGLSNCLRRPSARLGRVHLLPLWLDVVGIVARGTSPTGPARRLLRGGTCPCGRWRGRRPRSGDPRGETPSCASSGDSVGSDRASPPSADAERSDEDRDDREAHRHARERRHDRRPAGASPAIRTRSRGQASGAGSTPASLVAEAAEGRDRQDRRLELSVQRAQRSRWARAGAGRRRRPRRGRRSRPAPDDGGSSAAAELDHEAFASTSSLRREVGAAEAPVALEVDAQAAERVVEPRLHGARAGSRGPRPSPGATAAGGSRGRRRCGASPAGPRSRRGRSGGAPPARPARRAAAASSARLRLGRPRRSGSSSSRRRDSRE